VKGFTLPQAPSHQGVSSLGFLRLWDQGIYAPTYDEPVKYGFIVIALVRCYAAEILTAYRPFLFHESKFKPYQSILRAHKPHIAFAKQIYRSPKVNISAEGYIA